MKRVVLIADSDVRCYSQVRHRLIANNCEVFHASSIEDAVRERFDIGRAALLLVDLDVPSDRLRRDLSEVAQFNPGIRIIGVTEGDRGSDNAVRDRLDGVAEKPFALESLTGFADELLRNPPPWKEFRYLGRTRPGLQAGASPRLHRVLDYPPAYRGWGINE